MTTPKPSQSHSSRLHGWPLLAIIVIGLSLLAAYANSFRVPFIFDDASSITDNLTLRNWRTAFLPPGDSGVTVSGRPLLNATFALNWSLHRENIFGYHAFNLLIHALAALTLFGLIRRTLVLPALREKFGEHATPLALAVSAIWALHPLQTESVTYIIQRAESLVGLFYLFTLYGFVRSIDSPAFAHRWQFTAILSCLLGMVSKEVMVSAPVVVFLFDRTFVAGTFARAWHARRRFYFTLAVTWLLLALCIFSTGNRGGTVGLNGQISAWHYFLTQCHAITHYLRLTLWPQPLVLDYGTDTVADFSSVAGRFLFLVALGGSTVFALWKKPAVGFLGFVFFAVLAPTSSFIPVLTQTMAEHRMYLALAPIVVLFVIGLQKISTRLVLVGVLAVVFLFGTLTVLRNRDYRTAIGIWEDTCEKAPNNVRGLISLAALRIKQHELPEAESLLTRAMEIKPTDASVWVVYGNVLFELGRIQESIDAFQRALAFNSELFDVQYNYGKVLIDQGLIPQAIEHMEKAVALKPASTDACYNLGNAYLAAGKRTEAIEQYDAVLAVDPTSIDARNNRGNALVGLGRPAEALASFEIALRDSPNNARTLINLGRTLILLGRADEGLSCFEKAATAQANLPEAQANLAIALVSRNRAKEALIHFEKAIALGLSDPGLRTAYGHALLDAGRIEEAMSQYREVAARSPGSAEAHYALANLLLKTDRLSEAVTEYTTVLKLAPGSPDVCNNLGIAYARLGQMREARAAFEEALRLKPDFAEARENLERSRRR